MGCRWNSLKYLKNRGQHVKYNKKFSLKLNSDLGVPQGTVSRPIILHINDIVWLIENYEILLSANVLLLSTMFSTSGLDVHDTINSTNKYLLIRTDLEMDGTRDQQ